MCRGRKELSESKRNAPLEEVIEELVQVEEEKPQICAWYRCDQPVAPNKLRHCSELCRKRNNRWDYKQRQKALKKAKPS